MRIEPLGVGDAILDLAWFLIIVLSNWLTIDRNRKIMILYGFDEEILIVVLFLTPEILTMIKRL